jgi:transposase
MGLARSTVYGWLALHRDGGPDALRAKPIPGRPTTLTGEQIQQVYTLVCADPRQLQFDSALWTRQLVRESICQELGIAMSAASVGRLLRKMGMSPESPWHRRNHRRTQGRAAFWAHVYPALRRRTKADGGMIYFVSEVRVRSEYGPDGGLAAARERSTGGAPPTISKVTMIFATTTKGAFRFAIYQEDLNATVFRDFLQRLLNDAGAAGRRLYLVMDHRPAHRATATRCFVASTRGAVRPVFLPAHSRKATPAAQMARRPTSPGLLARLSPARSTKVR